MKNPKNLLPLKIATTSFVVSVLIFIVLWIAGPTGVIYSAGFWVLLATMAVGIAAVLFHVVVVLNENTRPPGR